MQRLENAKLLEFDFSLVDEKERKILERFIETTKGDGADLDKALAHPAINELFARGAITIRRHDHV